MVAIPFISALLGGGLVLAVVAASGGLSNTQRVTTTVQAAPLAPSNASQVNPTRLTPHDIYVRDAPGVVFVTSTIVQRTESPFGLFGGGGEAQQRGQATGSGIVINANGTILTNWHVVENAIKVTVSLERGQTVDAQVVGKDPSNDLAVLRIHPDGLSLRPLPLGDSSTVEVGQPVGAIGSPLGNEDSLAVGVISAVHRSIPALTVARYSVVDALQTDAAITHGDSGGPLFDARGRVIGINAQIRSQSGTGNDSGVGFAIPIDAAKRSVSQLIKTGHVAYAYVGITSQDLTPSLAQALGYSVKQGALVEDVRSGGPGADAGLRGSHRQANVLGYSGLCTGGDVIVAIDGKPVRNADDVVRIVSFDLQPRAVATFTIIRDNRRKTVAVTLGDRSHTAGAVSSSGCRA